MPDALLQAVTRDGKVRSGVLRRSHVQNNPVNFVDPYGMKAFPYHGFETLVAGLLTGQGWESFQLAWDSMWADWGTQSGLASDTIKHGMAGRDLKLGRPLTPEEAIERSKQFIEESAKCGKHGQALHTVQDLGVFWHKGQNFEGSNPINYPSVIVHWWMDFSPWGTIDNIRNSMRYMRKYMPQRR